MHATRPPTFERKEGEEADPVAIVSKSLETLTATVDERLKAIETKADTTKLVDRLDKLEAKVNRPGGSREEKVEAAEELKAWVNYLRKGPQRGGSVCLNTSWVFLSGSAAHFMPPPGLAAPG